MGSTRPQTAWCRRCGVQLAVPPGARSIQCALCHGVTRVDRPAASDPVRHAVGFLKSVFANMADGINSLMSPPPPHPYMRPSPYACQLPANFPTVHGKKRALLVGISYTNQRYELKGTVNDVHCMRFLLCKRFGFPNDCILVLTEEERDPYRIPTKENLRAAMRWLVYGCSSGDSLVFHFSGHGVQKLDNNDDEVDGYDEALCPFDFEDNGVILDDEVNETIVRPLPAGVKLHAIVDACHSGTVLDLPYLCRISRTGHWQWENHSPPSGVWKGTRGGLAILISGCHDSQTSADTTAFAGSTSTGAMTYSFIQAVESEPGTTYGRLLTAMRAAIRDSNENYLFTGPIGSLIRRVITFSCAQEPQLSASEPFDIYHKPFLL